MSSPKEIASNPDEENLAHVEEHQLDPSSSGTLLLTSPTSNDFEESAAVPKSSKSGKCRKNDHCVQQALRSLSRLSTSEEKFTAICTKYADIFDENRKLQAITKEQQKQIATLTKEKDHARSELMRTIFTKDRLENLCRELQRQNKEIRNESIQKIREEEQKRKEVSSKFQTTLNEITELMKQDSDKTMKLRDDNVDMTSKLKSIYEQYEIREQQVERMTKQMALESQLYEAKIAKLEMETAAEKEVLLREKQQLLLTLTEYQAKFQEYQNIEVTLRNQVALYNNKYEEFEKSLTRSNEVFGGFKNEMENMSNKIVKLESETAAWKLRWEKTQKALIEMASDKQKSDQEIVLAAKQMATLHKLCRTLQSERTQLLAKLKQNSFSNNSTKNNSNNADGVSNLLDTKIIDENLHVSQNYAEEKDADRVLKTREKSQVSEKSPGLPNTVSETDEKLPILTQRDCGQNTAAKVEELDPAIAQMDINEDMKNPDSSVRAEPSGNSGFVVAEEISVNDDDKIIVTSEYLHHPQVTFSGSAVDSSSVEHTKSELINELPHLSSDSILTERNGEEASEGMLLQNSLIPSGSEVKISTSLSENTAELVESALKNCVQNNKKKTMAKKKNKK